MSIMKRKQEYNLVFQRSVGSGKHIPGYSQDLWCIRAYILKSKVLVLNLLSHEWYQNK